MYAVDNQHETAKLGGVEMRLLFYLRKEETLGKTSEILTDGHKEIIRKQIISGARNYKKLLMDKVFLIVCEDGAEYEVRFFKGDYKHLTGVYSNLDDDFFEYCVNGKIDKGNIDTNQKYDWGTLKKKGRIIQNIHDLLYKDDQKTLLLEALDTNTYVFPLAIKDIANDICVGFVSDIHKARSLRRAKNSTNAKAEKRIIAVLAKNNGDKVYGELVYLSSVKGVYEKNESLIDKMDEPIMMRFMEILTRPE